MDTAIILKLMEVLGTFVWPALIAGFLIGFAPQIRALIGRVKGLKSPLGEVVFEDFEQKKQQVAEEGGVAQDIGAPSDEFIKLATLNADAAIASKWKEVQAVLTEVRKGMPEGNWRGGGSHRALLSKLAGHTLITENTIELFLKMQQIRNVAVHEQANFTVGEAIEFRDGVEVLVRSLRKALDRLKARIEKEGPAFLQG